MPRIIPLRGTEAQRLVVQAASKILVGELHATTDQERLFYQAKVVAPHHHGAVANEAAMLALNAGARGCWPGDTCKRSDKGMVYTCISNNGGLAADWVEAVDATSTAVFGSALLNGAAPKLAWYDTGSTANNRRWDIIASGDTLRGRLVNDADNASADWLSVTRVANAPTAVSLFNLNNTPIGNITPRSAMFTELGALANVPGDSPGQFRNSSATGYGWSFRTGDNTKYALAIINAAGSSTVAEIKGSGLAYFAGIDSTPIGANAASTAKFTSVVIETAVGQLSIIDTSSTANNRRFDFLTYSDRLVGRLVNDANSAATEWLVVTRSANTPTAISLWNLNNTPIGNVTPNTGAFLGISSGTIGSDGVLTLKRSSDGAGAATLSYIHSGQETRLFSAVGPVTVYASNTIAGTFTSTTLSVKDISQSVAAGDCVLKQSSIGGSGTDWYVVSRTTGEWTLSNASFSRHLSVTNAGLQVYSSGSVVGTFNSTGLNSTVIGASTPAAASVTTLDVTAGSARLQGYSSANLGVLWFGNTSNNYMFFDGSQLAIRVGGTDRITIGSNTTVSNPLYAPGFSARKTTATSGIMIVDDEGANSYNTIASLNNAQSSYITLVLRTPNLTVTGSVGATIGSINTLIGSDGSNGIIGTSTNHHLGVWVNATVVAQFNNVGLGIGGAAFSPLTVEKAKSNTVSESTAAARIGANDVYLFMGSLNGTPSYGTWLQSMNTANTPFPLILQPLGGKVLLGTGAEGSSILRLVGLPTSASGLSSGDVWNDSGTLKIA